MGRKIRKIEKCGGGRLGEEMGTKETAHFFFIIQEGKRQFVGKEL